MSFSKSNVAGEYFPGIFIFTVCPSATHPEAPVCLHIENQIIWSKQCPHFKNSVDQPTNRNLSGNRFKNKTYLVREKANQRTVEGNTEAAVHRFLNAQMSNVGFLTSDATKIQRTRFSNAQKRPLKAESKLNEWRTQTRSLLINQLPNRSISNWCRSPKGVSG